MTLAHNPSTLRTFDHRHRPGSQQALRARNLQALRHELGNNGPATQSQLAERTGLSRATVSSLVRILVEQNQVVTAPTVSSGRRATLVTARDQ